MNDAWQMCVDQINALPEDEQTVMSLRFEHGMNLDEMAATLKRDPEDVERVYWRAIRACQPELV